MDAFSDNVDSCIVRSYIPSKTKRGSKDKTEQFN